MLLSALDQTIVSTAMPRIIEQSLLMVRAGMNAYAAELVERIQRGMKVAFATSIVHMLERALWIIGLAVLIVLFIPEVPLRSRGGTAET